MNDNIDTSLTYVWAPQKVLQIYDNYREAYTCPGRARSRLNAPCTWTVQSSVSVALIDSCIQRMARSTPDKVSVRDLKFLLDSGLCEYHQGGEAAQVAMLDLKDRLVDARKQYQQCVSLQARIITAQSVLKHQKSLQDQLIKKHELDINKLEGIRKEQVRIWTDMYERTGTEMTKIAAEKDRMTKQLEIQSTHLEAARDWQRQIDFNFLSVHQARSGLELSKLVNDHVADLKQEMQAAKVEADTCQKSLATTTNSFKIQSQTHLDTIAKLEQQSRALEHDLEDLRARDIILWSKALICKFKRMFAMISSISWFRKHVYSCLNVSRDRDHGGTVLAFV